MREMKFGLRMDQRKRVRDDQRRECVADFSKAEREGSRIIVCRMWTMRVKVKGFLLSSTSYCILINDAFDESELRVSIGQIVVVDLLPVKDTWMQLWLLLLLPTVLSMCLSSWLLQSLARREVPFFYSFPTPYSREEETLFSCLISYSGTERPVRSWKLFMTDNRRIVVSEGWMGM